MIQHDTKMTKWTDKN